MTGPPVRPRLRVAVVGAGIGGLCTAAALIAGGADVLVYDREQNPEPTGFGLQLAPNATRLLRRLGILDRLAPGQAVTPDARELRRWDDGALIARTPLGATCAARYGAPYLALLRDDLLQAMLKVVGAHRVRPGNRLTGLVESQDRVDLLFDNGSTACADVVVGADGIRSTVRAGLSGDEPVFSGQHVYRGLAPADCLPRGLSEPRVTIWLSAGQHCIVYPVAGRGWMNFAATVSAGGAKERPGADVAVDLAAAYAGWDPALRAVLDAAQCLGVWALYDREPLGRWSTGRVTVVGDAAHPMLPFLAQGANQAVEDAVALAALLDGASSATIAPRLARYQAVRADRTAVVSRCSRRGALAHPEPAGPAATAPGPGAVDGKPSGDLDWLYGYDIERALTASRSPERFGQRQTGCGP